MHSIIESDQSGTLALEYAGDDSRRVIETYDLVVLSVGMQPSRSGIELAKTLDLELNDHQFIKTTDTAPVTTSRPGIFVAGVLQGCKDIPQSVVEASAAAGSAGIALNSARGSNVRAKEFPKEIEVAGQEARIGVFVCNCGTNIGGFADVPAITAYAKTLPNVVYAEENLFSCSQDTQEKIVDIINEQGLNRVVVAACTPRTHEPLFQETLRNAAVNPYLFEMANIRNQCTWVHSNDKQVATEKSKDLVRMAVSKATLLESIPDLTVPVNKSALVVGGGVAGMTAALSLAQQGFAATILEKSDALGGSALDVLKTWQGSSVPDYIKDLKQKVEAHPQVEVLLNSEMLGTSGFVGNFDTEVKIADADGSRKIQHGVAIIATGGQAAGSDEYLYGKSERVTRWHELEHQPDKLAGANTVAFIQCVGSRDDNRPYCSRICCTASVSQAISIKEAYPDTEVFILYRDIRTYGERELLYKKARELGVIFIRYSADNKPRVTETEEGLFIRVFEPVLQREVEIQADLLNLATAIVPVDNSALAEAFKLPLNAENFFLEAHAKLRPVDFATDGLFVCGLAHYPKSLDESIAQAMAAASRAATVLARESIKVSPLVSEIDAEECIGCGLCADMCPFGAIELNEVEGKGYRAKSITASCKGCGLCASSCPQKAIDMLHFRDAQIMASVCAVA